jgi:hypothetical protein
VAWLATNKVRSDSIDDFVAFGHPIPFKRQNVAAIISRKLLADIIAREIATSGKKTETPRPHAVY